jgi:predicted ATP-grasp superfamily ATP-dependent carboligase/peptidoglycan/xylan/chitin deacetylase (PgdA/CDA1 family)
MSAPGAHRRNVLVTEAAERGPLTACRSLAKAGYTVTAASQTRLAAGHWSRSCAKRLVLPDPKADPQAFVRSLVEFGHHREFAALVPGGEASLLAISEQRGDLEDLFSIGLPGHDVVEKSLDKVLLLREAAAARMPPPASIVCTGPKEAVEAAEELGYPVVLKPRRSILREPAGTRQQGIVLAASRAELERGAGELGAAFIAQRYESEAERLSCGGVVKDGKLLGLAVARFERVWPPLGGAASFAETVKPRDDLVSAAQTLLQSIGWQGVFELEVLAFGDGRLAAIDLNPRLFGWLALAVGAGADLPAIWCDVLLGHKRTQVVARPGVRYRWEDAEAFNLFRLLRRGDVAAAAALVRPQRGVVHAHFQWRDPAPLLARVAEVLVRRAKSRRQGPAPVDDSPLQHRSRVVAPVKGKLVRARSARWSMDPNGEPTAQGLRILFYHRVSDNRDDLAVPVRRFEEQMDYLQAEGYRVLGVADAFELLEAGNLPPRTIGLSFDDGYRDVAEHALLVLAERGFGATVFIVSGAVDGTASFRWYRRQPQLLGWDEIVQLDKEGPLRFEAHSVTHPNLAMLPREAAEAEIRGSKGALEKHLGRPTNVFCYPGGIFTAREEKLVADAGFRLAVSCNPGLNVAGGDRFALRRQPIEPRDNMLDFRAKLAGGHDSPLPLQRLYRRLRYPDEPTS